MVIESNILDFIFLKDGEQGESGKPGESGKTLYTWIKYSQNANGSNMTDDPDGAIYVGFAYNKESETESTNPSDYSWTKIKGEDGKQGEDAYTIILSNENISFATNQSNVPLSSQSVDCEVTVMKGSSIVTDFIIGTIVSVSGINISVLGRTITLSVTSSTTIENDSGSIIIPITVDGYTFNKIISYSISKAGVDGEDGKTLYTWIRYADSPTSGISSSPDGKKYMGVAYNKTTSEPSDTYSDYKWSLIEGDGIASVETERVKNTDKTTAPTSGWGTDNLTWESGTYIWTRLKITYKSGTIEYTEPQVSSEWEAANQVQDNLDKEIKKVNSTISGVSSKVDQNTKSITDKVWQTDISNSINNYDNTTAEAIRERVTKTETDISGIKSSVSDIQSEVEKKADGTTVQTLSEKVSTMEQDAASFKTTVSNTYSTKTETKEAVEGIVVGGRNLLKETKTFNNFSLNGWRIDGTKDGFNIAVSDAELVPGGFYDLARYGEIEPTPNTTYTLSFWAKGDGLFQSYFFPNTCAKGVGSNGAVTTEVDGRLQFSATNEWKKYWVTWTTLSDVTGAKNIIIARREYYVNGHANTLSVYAPKLEKGNKATDWTPAPEDTESKITTLSTQYTQLADRFNWLVTSDSSQSSLTLTDSMLAAMVKQFIVTSPDGSVTIISGGKITTDNIVGTNGWINLALGTFNYGNGALAWDGNKLTIGGSFKDEVLDEVTNGALTVLDDNLEVLQSDTVTVTSDSEELYANNIVSLIFAASDGSDGWVYYFNRRITIPKFEVNLSLSTFGDVTGFIVHRANGVNYVVWYENDKWYGQLADGTGSSFEWTWISATDIVLAEWTKKSAESIAYQVYSPAQSYEDIRKVAMLGNWAFGAISETTTINGGLIQTHSIITDKLATDAIKSLNYVYTAGTYSDSGSFFDLEKGSIISKNFAIDENGNAYFNGKIESVEGKIGGWNINTTSIYKGSSVFATAGTGNMYFGDSGLSIGNTFKVDSSGNMVVTAGNIGGWIITSTDIYNVDGTVGAGIGKYGTTNAFWAGSTYANRNSAPFRVGHNGALIANNATISGSIEAYTALIKTTLYLFNPSNTAQQTAIASSGSTLVLNGDSGQNQVGSGILALGDMTVSGAVNFANGTWNKMGDDCYIGDCNMAGAIGIQGINGYTGLYYANTGGGWYMSDETWMRTYNNKSIYSGTGSIYTGGGNFLAHTDYGLYCQSTGHWTIRTFNSSAGMVSVGVGNGSEPLRLFTSNKTWAGNSTTTYYSTTSSSDKRLKKDFGEITDAYEKMYMDTDVYSFRYILEDDIIHYGFMAQDVIENMNRYGIPLDNNLYGKSNAECFEKEITGDDYTLNVNYLEWIPLNKYMITKTIKRVDNLEERVEVLEEENKMLKQKLNIA